MLHTNADDRDRLPEPRAAVDMRRGVAAWKAVLLETREDALALEELEKKRWLLGADLR